MKRKLISKSAGTRALLLVLTLTSVGAGGQQISRLAAGPRAQSDGNITGRVLAERSNPLEGAYVVATPVGSPRGGSRVASLNFRAVQTDGEGRFTLENLPAAPYTIEVYSPGFVAEEEAGRRYFQPGDSAAIRLVKGGVISGTVTSSSGEPLGAVRVKAIRIKDSQRKPVVANADLGITRGFADFSTDDRGAYRIYGLQAGVYVVGVGGKSPMTVGINAFGNDAPTYYPSGPRAAAGEVAVALGQETSGIDIRYQDFHGHVVSGVIAGAPQRNGEDGGAVVVLANNATGTVEAMTFVGAGDADRGFVFSGIADGDYRIAAMSGSGTNSVAASPGRRLNIDGADVSGITLTLAPLATLIGRVVVDPATSQPPCGAGRVDTAGAVQQTVIAAQTDRADKAGAIQLERLLSLQSSGLETTPARSGEFVIRGLFPGRYRLKPSLANDNLYVRSIAMAGSTVDAAANGVSLKSGENRSGIGITLAEGAAAVEGKITADKSGERLPNGLHIILVPSEAEGPENVLRFYESEARPDATFALKNLSPGRYWILVTPSDEYESNDRNGRSPPFDPKTRAILRKQAEALRVGIELKRCQRVSGFLVKYPTKLL